MCWLLLVELGLRAEPYPWQSESVVDVKRELVYLIYFAYWPIHRYKTQAENRYKVRLLERIFH